VVKLALLFRTYMTEKDHGRLYAKAQNLVRSYHRALDQVDILPMLTAHMKASKQYELGGLAEDTT
jgi:hypothetical protein